MRQAVVYPLLAILALAVIYFLAWPVPIDPMPWQAPPNPGYNPPFAVNDRLNALETFDLGGRHGPEDIAVDTEGRIYAATHEGVIVRLDEDGGNPTPWAETGGRPLGIDFDGAGNLIVAAAFRGLLSIGRDGNLILLTDEVNGDLIRYADDVDVATDGKIYFSDASTRFGAREWGGTYEASLLDLMEHSSSGRLLVYDPATGKTEILLANISFANGVAVAPDQSFVLVVETGAYRVIRYWLAGPRAGQSEPLIEALPSFPDNVSAGMDGRFWVALVSPRNFIIDALADKPFWRKVIQRMPLALRPGAVAYGHIIAIDAGGKVVADLQDPHGGNPMNTSVTESAKYLYIGSLVTPVLARLPKAVAGLD